MQVGGYMFSVAHTTMAVNITNSPLAVYIYPAASAADASGVVVNATSLAAGATATVAMYLNNMFGDPAPTAQNATLTTQGEPGPCMPY